MLTPRRSVPLEQVLSPDSPALPGRAAAAAGSDAASAASPQLPERLDPIQLPANPTPELLALAREREVTLQWLAEQRTTHAQVARERAKAVQQAHARGKVCPSRLLSRARGGALRQGFGSPPSR